jgi:uncharacterized protein YeaO (DUF488 family)
MTRCAALVAQALRPSITIPMIQLKRAYEPSSSNDGQRVLVDRLWPRGLRKADARLDRWLKDVAPSEGLRRWFGHEPSRFPEFARRYRRELRADAARATLSELARLAANHDVTFLYAAHDAAHNNAVVLAQEVERRLASVPRRDRVPARALDRTRTRPRARRS